MPVYLLLLLHFASFSYHFISFFASNCLRVPLFTILLEGVHLIAPGFKKVHSQSFNQTFDRTPPPIRCNIATNWSLRMELVFGLAFSVSFYL